MIRLKVQPLGDDPVAGLQKRLQMAVELEWSTLPPYLYALLSIRRGHNAAAARRIQAVVHEEMVHMCLACNVLNAIGGAPLLADASTVPQYPGPLPGDIGSESTRDPWQVHLLAFSKAAMQQAMHIEEPEDGPIVIKSVAAGAAAQEPEFQTIGEFYHWLDRHLQQLPDGAWHRARHQIGDGQFFAGELFAVNGYRDAHRAIDRIVSQGEGGEKTPLDFQGELAHFYRFEEIFENRALTKSSGPSGYSWGEPLGVDWSGAYPAIRDPATHDFSNDPTARSAQDACDRAFTAMVRELQHAVNGSPARLGNAVRCMFQLRMAALEAFNTPLAGTKQVAGPAFRYRPDLLA